LLSSLAPLFFHAFEFAHQTLLHFLLHPNIYLFKSD